MKKGIVLLFISLIGQFVFSQDLEKCKEVVKITTEAINSKSVIELQKHLAADFEIAGQKGKIAKKVLPLLVTQLNEKVLEYKELNNKREQNSLTLIYNITYEKMGTKSATFVFNDQNQLKSVKLFEMKVKTMKNTQLKPKLPNQDFITIPFQKVGNLIAVEVTLNNKKRVFLLDSGSPKLILNSHYLEKNTDKVLSSGSKGVNGAISGMNITKIEKMSVAGITIEDKEVLTMDISHLEKNLNTDLKIYGLIGYDMLKDYDVLFDYHENKVTLIKPTFFEQYKKKYLVKNKLEKIPFSLKKHLPIFNAKIDNENYTFGLDCGAASNLIDKKLFDKLSNQITNEETTHLSGADKDRKKVIEADMQSVTIGNRVFKNMRTVFNSISHLNNGYKLNLDGLMGYPLLSKQKTLISYQRKEIVFIN